MDPFGTITASVARKNTTTGSQSQSLQPLTNSQSWGDIMANKVKPDSETHTSENLLGENSQPSYYDEDDTQVVGPYSLKSTTGTEREEGGGSGWGGGEEGGEGNGGGSGRRGGEERGEENGGGSRWRGGKEEEGNGGGGEGGEEGVGAEGEGRGGSGWGGKERDDGGRGGGGGGGRIGEGGESRDEGDDTGEDKPSTEEGGSEDRGRESGGWAGERVGRMVLFGVPIVTLYVQGQERLCLAQISASLLHEFSYNEIHNRRVALGITCVQCTPAQLEVLRRAGAMPVTSRRCGLITRREAERLVRSFISDVPPPRLPDNFTFKVRHQCGWGNEGVFVPARYNSSRAKCIRCLSCHVYFSPNKFIFHFHPSPDPSATYRHPDAANFNSWRRHLELVHGGTENERLRHAWEDVKAMFNGGCRRRVSAPSSSSMSSSSSSSPSYSSQPSLQSAGRALHYQASPVSRGGLMARQSAQPYLAHSGAHASATSHSGKHCDNKSGSDTNNVVGAYATLGAYTPLSAMNPPQLSATTLRAQGPGALSLLPSPVSANTHPAFFPASGLQGHAMSYGDYLRSMSRPYNVSHLPIASSTLPLDLYRSQTSSLVPAMLSANPYPLSYFGYPPFFGAAASDAGKGSNPMYFRPQFPPFPGLVSQQRDIRIPDQRNDGHDEKTAAADQQERSTPPTTEENFRMDEDTEEEEEEEIIDGKEEEEILIDKKTTNSTERSQTILTTVRPGSCTLHSEQKVSAVENAEIHLAENSQDSNNLSGCHFQTTDEENRREGAGQMEGESFDQEKEESEQVGVGNEHDQMQAAKVSAQHDDTENLLKMFEDTENVTIFDDLPLELQRLQRLRAQELKEELSRQFLTIKETLWSDIEQERKMRAVLQDRLAEVQNLAPRSLESPYSMFSHMK